MSDSSGPLGYRTVSEPISARLNVVVVINFEHSRQDATKLGRALLERELDIDAPCDNDNISQKHNI